MENDTETRALAYERIRQTIETRTPKILHNKVTKSHITFPQALYIAHMIPVLNLSQYKSTCDIFDLYDRDH